MSSTAWLDSLRRVYKAEIKLAAGLRSCLEAQGVKFASKFILVVGRIWFLGLQDRGPHFLAGFRPRGGTLST